MMVEGIRHCDGCCFHMVEETARHLGHVDAIRELLDGEKGYY